MFSLTIFILTIIKLVQYIYSTSQNYYLLHLLVTVLYQLATN